MYEKDHIIVFNGYAYMHIFTSILRENIQKQFVIMLRVVYFIGFLKLVYNNNLALNKLSKGEDFTKECGMPTLDMLRFIDHFMFAEHDAHCNKYKFIYFICQTLS